MSLESNPSPLSGTPSTTGATLAPARTGGVQLAVTLLSLSIATFLAAQILNAAQGQKALNWQLGNGQKQIEAAKESEKQLEEISKQTDALVKQAEGIYGQYQKLLDDLLKLADDDADAKAVVEKWRIQRSAPAAPAAGSESNSGK